MCKVVLLVLGISSCAIGAKITSGSGCECTSGCGKSWRLYGSSWCYVDKQCKSAGWDSCADTNAVSSDADVQQNGTDRPGLWQKLQETLKLDDTNLKAEKKREGDLQTNLDETKAQLKESVLNVASLKTKLHAALAEEAKAENRAEEAERKERGATAGVKQKLSDTEKALKETQLKLNETDTKEKEDQEKIIALQKDEQQKVTALQKEEQEKVAALQKQAQDKIAAMKKEKDEKVGAFEKEKQDLVKALKKEAEDKLNDAEAKRKEAVVKHSQASLKLHDAQLKLSGTEKQLAKTQLKVKAANMRFRGAQDVANKFKAKALQADKALKKAATTIKTVAQKYTETKKQLADTEKTRDMAYKELNPFRSAVIRAVLS